MILLDPRFWLVALVTLLGAYGGGRWHQYRSDMKDVAASALSQSEGARLRERSMQVTAQRIADENASALRRVAGQRDAAFERLRDRPDRLPEPARAACAGTDGRQLSRPDAEFLVGLAARADTLRAALDACQKREAVGP
jgi:hypothetical protein